jgi:hypothetical protein
MSSGSTLNKQGRTGKRKQAWTERALARAGRACPDRLLRLNLQTGVLELVPPTGEGVRAEHEKKNPLDRVLKDAAHKDRTP